jgi:hypothetical protein
VPLRGQSPHIAVLREVAAQHQAPFVSFRDVFREHSPDQTPGGNLFIDHCHPRPCGQFLMAEAVAHSLCAQGRLAPADCWQWDRMPNYATALKQMRMTPEEWRAAERTVITAVFPTAPEVAADMTATPPPFADENDVEWNALHLLALWQCNRHDEVGRHWAQLRGSERAAMNEFVPKWPKPVQENWARMINATKGP